MSLVTVDIGDLSDRALHILLIHELKGLRMDIAVLKQQILDLTTELNTTGAALAATKTSLDTSNTVVGKVVDEETGLLVRIQSLLDALNNPTVTVPPDVAAAMADATAAMAAVKAAAAGVDLSAASVATTAGAADALVPDQPPA